MSGLAAGVNAFKKKKAELEANSGGMRDVYNFQLKDGEEAVVFFLGLFRSKLSKAAIEAMAKAALKEQAEVFRAYRRPIGRKDEKKKETLKQAVLRRMKEDEPKMFSAHRINHIPWSMTCAVETPSWPERENCVGCHQNAINSKKWTRAQQKFGFTVLDMRRSHSIRSRNENEKSKFQFCLAEYDLETGESDEDCKWCNRASESDKSPIRPARIIGVRQWTVGTQWATTIMGVNDKLSRRCLNCERGKIKSVGWCCGNPDCMDLLRIDSGENRQKCRECDETNFPLEDVECTRCDEPLRATLADAPISVTRSGSTKDDTSYNLAPEGFLQLPEYVRAWARAVDWHAQLMPPPTVKQAALLGLNSDPFSSTATGSDEYDDDDIPE